MAENIKAEENNKDETPFIIVHPMSIVLNNILIKYTSEQIEKLSSEDLIEAKINLELNQNTFIKMELKKETEDFFKTGSIVAAGTSIPLRKEIFVFPDNIGVMSFRVFYKLMELHSKETDKKDVNIEDYINKKELLQAAKENKVVELLKSKPILIQVTEDMFVVIGKMTKVTWDILSAENNVVTTIRLYNNPQDFIPGYALLTSQSLGMIKDVIDNGGIVELEKDFAELLKPNNG